jgi:hypothetical protein
MILSLNINQSKSGPATRKVFHGTSASDTHVSVNAPASILVSSEFRPNEIDEPDLQTAKHDKPSIFIW